MDVVGIGKGTDLMDEIPTPPTYLGTKAKSHFKNFGKILIGNKQLKRIHLPALAVMSENFEQWEWAVKEIRSKNKKKHGSGYIQKFATGAKNISVEVTLKRDAEKAIMQCFKQFGLDPKSEKELKGAMDPDQGDLFTGFNNRKTSN
ncbi:P27 family phage terminase small subunit [Aquimarina sp. 2201CG14-23]|uniref:P27 family phage terminase small subunit n=1 Tax=Aquimarina mycalae TaxID=3040073 RepID=UPI0024781370|nr:P27 family phage terminase small subunit [Aquimarina sp. 2201CG14-23]MDH7444662.1 P27 family phage terminase small subunit [Aquimarina sp. 2201CG14-23]